MGGECTALLAGRVSAHRNCDTFVTSFILYTQGHEHGADSSAAHYLVGATHDADVEQTLDVDCRVKSRRALAKRMCSASAAHRLHMRLSFDLPFARSYHMLLLL